MQGRFEELDVRFDGQTLDQVHTQCMGFVARANNLDWVDDVVLNGTTARNRSSYWRGEALCALVALNARPQGATRENAVWGTLEEVPFEVHGHADHVRAALARYLPLAVDMQWADDLVVNGQTRRNRGGYWSIDEVVMMVLSLAPALPVPPPPPVDDRRRR